MNDLLIGELTTAYFNWLCELVECEDHWVLLGYLQGIPFMWTIEMDENRAMDGVELRDRYAYDTMYSKYETEEHDCSVLEFLVGLAVRMNDTQVGIGETEHVAKWFWVIMNNLSLDKFTDFLMENDDLFNDVDEIITKLMDRKYDRDGFGGLFPLQNPPEDQRYVDIWYQMNTYLLENY